MKVRAIKTFTNLTDIFVQDDILELEIIKRKTDVELFPQQTKHDKDSGRVVVIAPAVIAKAGDYESYVLITANGKRYPESTIHNAIGYVPLKNIFEKINAENLVV